MITFLTCSAYCVADDIGYEDVWAEIDSGDYELANYNLHNMTYLNTEDLMHQELMKLYIALKMKNERCVDQMLTHIDQLMYQIVQAQEMSE